MSSDSKFLKDADIEKLIERKIENEIKSEIDEANKNREVILVKELNQVPKGKTFSLNSTYKVFNRKTKKESFINGAQADSLLGLNQSVRDDIESGYVDNFTVNEYYIRFHVYRGE